METLEGAPIVEVGRIVQYECVTDLYKSIDVTMYT